MSDLTPTTADERKRWLNVIAQWQAAGPNPAPWHEPVLRLIADVERLEAIVAKLRSLGPLTERMPME